jgi:hypothetical protein
MMAAAFVAMVPVYDRRCALPIGCKTTSAVAARRAEQRRMADYYARATKAQEDCENAEARENAFWPSSSN